MGIAAFSVLTPVSAGGGTLTLGVGGSAAFWIAATPAVTIVTGDYWMSATPNITTNIILGKDNILGSNGSIVSAVAVADITGGTITVITWWLPGLPGASLV